MTWSRRLWLLLAAAAVLLVWMYGAHGNTEQPGQQGSSAILWMVRRWQGAGGDLSHGWLVPLIAGAVVWRRRAALREAVGAGGGWGLAAVVAALVLYALGLRAQQTRLVLVSLIGLLWGIPAFVFGRRVGRLLVTPALYLLFCVPLSFLDSITFPLRQVASVTAGHLLNGFGVSVVRVGTVIRSAGNVPFALDVADACSGLRYLLALMAVTGAYAFFVNLSGPRKALLFAASVPIAVAANVVRILTIGIVARSFGQEAAMGVYHDYSGYIVFASGVLFMLSVQGLLSVSWRERLSLWRTRVQPP
jgi:exosortase